MDKKDNMIKDAIILCIITLVLGAVLAGVYMLTKEFRISHPEVNWRQIECMRHVLVHGYYTIDPDSLWDTIQNDIPALKSWIEIYLKEMDEPI